MNLYLLERIDYIQGMNYYESIMVSAKNKHDAIRISPHEDFVWDKRGFWRHTGYTDEFRHWYWPNNLEDIKITLLGIYNKKKSKVILATLNHE